jgi:hypothetical protein
VGRARWDRKLAPRAGGIKKLELHRKLHDQGVTFFAFERAGFSIPRTAASGPSFCTVALSTQAQQPAMPWLAIGTLVTRRHGASFSDRFLLACYCALRLTPHLNNYGEVSGLSASCKNGVVPKSPLP